MGKPAKKEEVDFEYSDDSSYSSDYSPSPKASSPKKKSRQAKHSPPAKAAAKKKTSSKAGAASKGSIERNLLTAAIQLTMFSNKPIDKKTVAIAAGHKSIETKSVRNAFKALRDEGDFEFAAGQKILVTEQGRAKVPVAAKPKTNAEMQAHLVKVITVPNYKKGCGAMIEALKDGSAKTRLEVANEMGFARIDSSGFKHCFKCLKEHGLIEIVEGGKVRLSDMAFPQGRPI